MSTSNQLFTNKQVISVCNSVIRQLKKETRRMFLCVLIAEAIVKRLPKNNLRISPITSYIPEFTLENAILHANADKRVSKSLAWWLTENNEEFNFKDRIKFIKWIKKEYQKKFKQEPKS